ncbi:MAG: hypothetical protein ACWA5T_03050 [Parvularcula sp.]
MTASLLVLIVGVVLLVYAISGAVAHAGLFADPVSPRSNHTKPTSRAGGMLVVGCVAAIDLIFSLFGGFPLPPMFVYPVLGAALLGGLDDAVGLPAIPKLVALMAIALVGVVLTGPIPSLPLPFMEAIPLPAGLSWPLTVLFVIGFVNAFNFMDGLNGMAAGTALVGCFLVIALAATDDAGLVLVAVLTSAALFGFSLRNIRQGTIFMGDAGSLGVGTFIALAAVHSSSRGGVSFWCFLLPFVPFLTDTIVTFVKRLLSGAPVLDAHKEHFYQRLRVRGWSHQAISLAYMAMSLLGAAVGFAVVRTHAGGLILPAALGLIGVYAAVMVAMFRRGEPQS